jgi:hypothetical protein
MSPTWWRCYLGRGRRSVGVVSRVEMPMAGRLAEKRRHAEWWWWWWCRRQRSALRFPEVSQEAGSTFEELIVSRQGTTLRSEGARSRGCDWKASVRVRRASLLRKRTETPICPVRCASLHSQCWSAWQAQRNSTNPCSRHCSSRAQGPKSGSARSTRHPIATSYQVT